MQDTHRIHVFLAAAEAASFSGAAKRMKMSQPAVSLQIQALERQLGVELFRRTGRAVELTEPGQALLPLARQLIELSSHIEETMSSLRGKLVGRLTVGCAASAANRFLPEIAVRFKRLNPDVHVSLQTMDAKAVLDRLESRELDLGVVSFLPRRGRFNHRELVDDEFWLVVPAGHPWAQRPSISLRELADASLVLGDDSSDARRALNGALARAGASQDGWRVVMELGSPEAIVQAVGDGIGASLVSAAATRCLIADRDVAVVPLREGTLQYSVYFCRNADAVDTCAKLGFCDYVYSPEIRAVIDQRCKQGAVAPRLTL